MNWADVEIVSGIGDMYNGLPHLRNIVAITLAAGVLYKWVFLLNPAIGAVLMSLSTIVLALNAQLLKRQLK